MISDELNNKEQSQLPEDMQGWIMIQDPYKHIHIIPVQQKHIHSPSTACWCEPFIDYRNVLTDSEV
jgi:hypothetical protein